jgi:hypothetical protein
MAVHDAPDHTLLAYPPLYTPSGGSSSPPWIYYEVTFPRATNPSSSSSEITLALGLCALPYPPFRLPGWHRGSLGVHGDDGNRFVNDDAGGASFVAPFRRGHTYGLGLTWAYGRGTVVFTCDGVKVGGWDLCEERDPDTFGDEDEGIVGLEGGHDVCAAIGAFGSVACEVVFDPARWMYRGRGE